MSEQYIIKVNSSFSPSRKKLFRTLALTFFYLLFTLNVKDLNQAWACGVNAHLWITDSAICQLPFGSKLREFYSSQNHVDLTRLGSAFPDSGYAINHEYGEITHWPPFILSYIQDFHERHGAVETDWSQEALAEVAFMLGVAAHGYEDELFDSQFLRWIEQEDQANQDVIDPALDFLLIYEGHTELLPPLDFPILGVSSALQRAGVEVSPDEVETGVARVHQFALRLSQRPSALEALVERDAPLIPWASRHYLHSKVTGSLAHEPQRVAAMLEGLYQRLSGQSIANEVISHIDPSSPAKLSLSNLEAGGQNQWITLYFKTGVITDSLVENIQILSQGVAVPFNYRSTRWGGGEGYTRLFEISPSEPRSLSDQQVLEISIQAGIEILGGDISTQDYNFEIELCRSCEELGEEELRFGGLQQGCFVPDESFADMNPILEIDQTLIAQDFAIQNPEKGVDQTIDMLVIDRGMQYFDEVLMEDNVVSPQNSNQGCYQSSADATQRFNLWLVLYFLMGGTWRFLRTKN